MPILLIGTILNIFAFIITFNVTFYKRIIKIKTNNPYLSFSTYVIFHNKNIHAKFQHETINEEIHGNI